MSISFLQRPAQNVIVGTKHQVEYMSYEFMTTCMFFFSMKVYRRKLRL